MLQTAVCTWLLVSAGMLYQMKPSAHRPATWELSSSEDRQLRTGHDDDPRDDLAPADVEELKHGWVTAANDILGHCPSHVADTAGYPASWILCAYDRCSLAVCFYICYHAASNTYASTRSRANTTFPSRHSHPKVRSQQCFPCKDNVDLSRPPVQKSKPESNFPSNEPVYCSYRSGTEGLSPPRGIMRRVLSAADTWWKVTCRLDFRDTARRCYD